MPTLRIAQISDLHFAALTLNPLQLFSKRWLGNLNSWLSRKKAFSHERLSFLAPLLKEENVSHLIVTGDLSTTSHPKEFKLAQKFFQIVENQDIVIHSLPGNHDNYTQRAFKKKTFYRFFNSSLKDTGVSLESLGLGFWLITLDTTLATSLFSSHGLFTEAVEKTLEQLLAQIPPEDKVILANHFPLFEQETARKTLKRADALRSLVQRHPQIIFYLHGHTHVHCIADLRDSKFPIILDCGSTPYKKTGTFHILELEKERYQVKVYRWEEGWRVSQKAIFHV